MRRARFSGWVAVALACGLSCRPAPSDDRPEEPAPTHLEANTASSGWFEGVEGPGVGLDFVYASGAAGKYLYPEILGGGVGLCDVDGDGDLDVFLPQGGTVDGGSVAAEAASSRLFFNRPDGRFEDVTEVAGAGVRGPSMGVACGDIDNDGDLDLYVTNLGPNVLLRNRGDGTFEDATAAAGVGDPSWGASATFFDGDGDGWLDLYVTNNLHWSPRIEKECYHGAGGRDYCGPLHYRSPARDTLYRNLGGGRFEDVSVAAGLGSAFGNGLGVVAADFDGDSRIDLYVANDETANQLWINQGDGRFVDQALLAGVALSGTGSVEAGMGVVAEDVDADGWPDLFVTHLSGETNTFYANQGGVFADVTSLRHLSVPSQPWTGFGTGMADFDLDGRLDLFVANGRVRREEPILDPDDHLAEPDQLFQGLSDGTFRPVALSGAPREPATTSRGAAFGDLDRDGDLDIVVVRRDRPVALFRGLAADAGEALGNAEDGRQARSAQFRLTTAGGRDATGAVVTVRTEGGLQSRQVQPGYSYLATNDPETHFGLGPWEEIQRLEVRWPDGRRSSLGPLPVGRRFVVRQSLD